MLKSEKPDLVLVVGDVNSTLACSLVAAKLHVPIAHVEAGVRSFDRRMPEEINRIVTDTLSDLLFTPSRYANQNLLRQGIPTEKIHFVGNVMVDSLLAALSDRQRTHHPGGSTVFSRRITPYLPSIGPQTSMIRDAESADLYNHRISLKLSKWFSRSILAHDIACRDGCG